MPQSEVETVVFPEWAMLDRRGRTRCCDGSDATGVAVKKNKTAAPVDMDGGPSCYVSFTLAAPQKGLSYLKLYWPEKEYSANRLGHAFVRATDKDLILFEISIEPIGPCCVDSPPDLFVYKTAGSPSVQRLPRCTEDSDWTFLMTGLTTGILRLTGDHYIVAELNVTDHQTKGTRAQLCVFDSKTEVWKIKPKKPVPQPLDQSNDVQFPNLWSTDNVFAFAGRFLCWIDYFSGVLLCDFSVIDSPVLRFVPFPGENEYSGQARVERCLPDRFRSVSISRGKIRFVHIDNDYHHRVLNGRQYLHRPDGQQQPHHTITIWTLNSKFKWVTHHVINLHHLWKQPDYQALDIDERLPELPIMSVDDPDVLCCMLREKDFGSKGWMIMLDKHASLRSCTRESEDTKARYDEFPSIPLLPTIFRKYLEGPTGMTVDNVKVATVHSKKHKRSFKEL